MCEARVAKFRFELVSIFSMLAYQGQMINKC